ncbi:MAG: class I SAM-dependent methyltransferase [Bacteroidota bacterium]
MEPKYDRIGDDYNHTRKADPYLLDRFHQLLAYQSGQTILDIGCGTGNYTIGLHQKGVQLIGVDPSEKMLTEARAKHSHVHWVQAAVESLPLDDQSVDGIVASLTMHHWQDPASGFRELYRIAKAGSRMLLFTSDPQQMAGYWLNAYFPKMLEVSMQQMPRRESIIAHLSEAGFEMLAEEKYFVRPDLQDLFLYAGKERPQMYLDPGVRKGISSFSDLAHQLEVEIGLAQLQADIQSGHIDTVIKSYENETGDYLFLVAQKPA